MPQAATKTDAKEFKTFDARLKIKQVESDDEFVHFEGYGSTFNNVDLGGDAVMPGAFKDSLLRKMPKLCYQHDMGRPLGIIDEAYEDDKGLYIKGRMPKAHSLVKDVEALLKIGAITEFSIGYSTMDAEYREGIRQLKELDLWEISFVTVAMNPKAVLTSVKSINDVKEEIKTQRDFERVLRESGLFSKEASVHLASFFQPNEGEPHEEIDEQTEEVKKSFSDFTSNLTKLIGDLK